MNSLIDLPQKIFSKIGVVSLSLLVIALLIVCLIIVVLLSLIKKDYGLKKRLWFVFLSMGATMLVYTSSRLTGQGNGWFLCVLSLSLLFCVPVFFLPTKKVKFEKSYRNFVRYIDGQIKTQQEQEQIIPPTPYREQTERLTTRQEQPEQKSFKDFELDFMHVKSVIQRLDYYGLSQADKKMVKELEQAIIMAENGDYSPQIKSRINDGLGALLKIMSKYGV